MAALGPIKCTNVQQPRKCSVGLMPQAGPHRSTTEDVYYSPMWMWVKYDSPGTVGADWRDSSDEWASEGENAALKLFKKQAARSGLQSFQFYKLTIPTKKYNRYFELSGVNIYPVSLKERVTLSR